jgi:trimethylamine:corrinoid methyltransferase-like protein
LAAGGTTLAQRLNARVKQILKEHQPKPLDPKVKDRIHEILAQAKD